MQTPGPTVRPKSAQFDLCNQFRCVLLEFRGPANETSKNMVGKFVELAFLVFFFVFFLNLAVGMPNQYTAHLEGESPITTQV